MQQRRTTASGRNSVFSEAQESVRILVRNEKASKIIGAKFWFYFRLVFPCSSSILALLLFLIPYLANADASGYLFSGSALSFFFCSCVVFSYMHILPWRKHPSPLIFYRSCSHCLFSLILMINSYVNFDSHSSQCKLLSVMIQFSYFTGECWLLTISLDLILSLTNPFSSYKNNLRRYHIVVWTSGVVIGGILLNSDQCQDTFMDGVCWIDASFECVLGFYLVWVVMFYIISICVMIFSAWRISRGLQSTYSTRKACVQDTFYIVASYVAYSIGVFVLFMMVTPGHRLDQPSDISGFSKNIIAYLLALRGFVDAVLWFTMHDFNGNNNNNKSKSKPSSSLFSMLFSSPLLEINERESASAHANENSMCPDLEMATETEGEGDFGIDLDLSPQLNMALRQEVVHFTTMGIIRSVDLTMEAESESSMTGTGTAQLPEPTSQAVRVFPLEDKSHIFSDYEPDTFRRLRVLNNVEERWYQAQISQPAKERLAEGGSGAFMFFCGSGEFMVKTVESDEANNLLEILEEYELHLKENVNSLLVRFLGLHSLKMYNRIFSFVVMRNIFPPLATINQRYDIKGSWVNRNSAPVPPGMRVFCRHCGDLFVSGSQISCPDVAGEHEANLVLKDNDFTSKIRLKPDDAYNLIDVLNKDSDALCSMGITDYSLLIGIRNLQYEVDPGRIISQRRKSLLSFSDSSSSIDNMQRPEDFSTLVPHPALKRTQSLSSKDSGQRILMKNTFQNASTTRTKDVIIQENYNEDTTHRSKTTTTKENRESRLIVDLDLVMEEELAGGYLARSVVAPGVYYMGAVDILQKWTIRKRLERLYKIYVLGKSGSGLSCMAPEPYKVRFQQKVSQIIEHSIFIREITGSWKGKRELTEPTTLIDA